jgi:hypothetical protein
MKRGDVKLNSREIARAVSVAERRQRRAVEEGRTSVGAAAKDPLKTHIVGAMGELAFCKIWGLEWPATVDNYGGADVGDDIEVRTRTKWWYELKVVPKGRDDFIHALVVMDGEWYRYIGWMMGREAKQERWRRNYGDYGRAYFVPQSELQYDLPDHVFARAA